MLTFLLRSYPERPFHAYKNGIRINCHIGMIEKLRMMAEVNNIESFKKLKHKYNILI